MSTRGIYWYSLVCCEHCAIHKLLLPVLHLGKTCQFIKSVCHFLQPRSVFPIVFISCYFYAGHRFCRCCWFKTEEGKFLSENLATNNCQSVIVFFIGLRPDLFGMTTIYWTFMCYFEISFVSKTRRGVLKEHHIFHRFWSKKLKSAALYS